MSRVLVIGFLGSKYNVWHSFHFRNIHPLRIRLLYGLRQGSMLMRNNEPWPLLFLNLLI